MLWYFLEWLIGPIGSLMRFWTAHVNRKWGLFHFNVPSCDAATFVLPLYFLLMNLLMSANSSLLIGVRRSKTPLLRTVSLWTNTTRTSGLNFRQLSVVNGSAFSEVPKQTRQPREVNPNISKIFSKQFSFHSRPVPRTYRELRWGEGRVKKWFQGRSWRVAAINVHLGRAFVK